MKKINKIQYYSGIFLLAGLVVFPAISNAQVDLKLNGNVNVNAGQKDKSTSTVDLNTKVNTDKATGTKIDFETKNEIKTEEKK